MIAATEIPKPGSDHAQLANAASLWCRLLNAPRLYPKGHPARNAAALEAAAAFATIKPTSDSLTLGFAPDHMMVNGAAIRSAGVADAADALHQLGLAQLTFQSVSSPELLDAVAQVLFDSRVGASSRELAETLERISPDCIRCVTVPDAARGLVSGDAQASAPGWSAILRELTQTPGAVADDAMPVVDRMYSAMEAQLKSGPGQEFPSGFDAASLSTELRNLSGSRADSVRLGLRAVLAKASAEELASLLRLDQLVGDDAARDLDTLADVLPIEMIVDTLEHAAPDHLRPSEESLMLIAKLAGLSTGEGSLRRIAFAAERASVRSEADANAWRSAVHELLRSPSNAESYTPADYTSLLQRSVAAAAGPEPALQSMVLSAWTPPRSHRARILLDLLRLAPDPPAWVPLITALHEQVSDSVADPEGLVLLAEAAELIASRAHEEVLRTVAARWRERLGQNDVQTATLCAAAGDRLPLEHILILLDSGAPSTLASLIADAARHQFLAPIVARLLSNTGLRLRDLRPELSRDPDAAAAGLTVLAPKIPSAVLMTLATPLLSACSATAAVALAAALDARCGPWPIEALSAALSHPAPAIVTLAMSHVREREESEIADLLARFFRGEIGTASGRAGFEAAASAWAGPGPDRRRKLAVLTMFLFPSRTLRPWRRAWWSLSLILRSAPPQPGDPAPHAPTPHVPTPHAPTSPDRT